MTQDQTHTLIAVGTGFATTFFLHRFLAEAGPDARVLVLERGPNMSGQQLIDALPDEPLSGEPLIETQSGFGKNWRFSVGFGGGSNCWWACTPRMLPNDFRLRSLYGTGEDWPLSYDDLEPYYAEAEAIMAISGPEATPWPMSRPYPQGPHRLSEPDRILQAHFGDAYIPQPTARSRDGTANRSACCASGVCSNCPVNAKFTIENEMGHVYADPRVTLLTGAEVLQVITEGGVATGVRYRAEGREVEARGDMVALGANAIFNASILLASGFDDAALGRYLTEQCGVEAHILLDGVKNFQGSTVITANGFMFYDGPHRATRAGCMVESFNRGKLRLEYGRWAETISMRLIYEDAPQADNRVVLGADGKPLAVYEARSAYAEAGIATARATFEKLLAPLPVESVQLLDPTKNEAHVLGTARMGDDPETSVVDADLVHHQVRNLLVLGGSSFVTCAPANPTLTLSALSLRAAARLFGDSD